LSAIRRKMSTAMASPAKRYGSKKKQNFNQASRLQGSTADEFLDGHGISSFFSKSKGSEAHME
jgi:hypothetical protein